MVGTSAMLNHMSISFLWHCEHSFLQKQVTPVLQNVQSNGSVLNWNYCKTGVNLLM